MDKNLIQVIAHKLSEAEALLLETKLIKLYGRKDINTGILRNLTDGGDGTSGKAWTKEAKMRVAAAKTEWHKTHDVSGENNANYGNKWSDAQRLSARARALEQGFIGSRKGVTPWNKGSATSDDTKSKMSVSRLLTPKVSCPHCGKVIAPHILSRFHGEKCKLSV